MYYDSILYHIIYRLTTNKYNIFMFKVQIILPKNLVFINQIKKMTLQDPLSENIPKDQCLSRN